MKLKWCSVMTTPPSVYHPPILWPFSMLMRNYNHSVWHAQDLRCSVVYEVKQETLNQLDKHTEVGVNCCWDQINQSCVRKPIKQWPETIWLPTIICSFISYNLSLHCSFEGWWYLHTTEEGPGVSRPEGGPKQSKCQFILFILFLSLLWTAILLCFYLFKHRPPCLPFPIFPLIFAVLSTIGVRREITRFFSFCWC